MTDHEQPAAGVALKPAHVYVEVSGLTGTGKSAVMGEIEIALKALGLTVEHDASFRAEKNANHADWQTALDLYKPTVVLRERNVSRAPTDAGGAVSEAMVDAAVAVTGDGRAITRRALEAALTPAPQAEGEECKYCGPGVMTGLPGNACENCMGTGLSNPPEDTEAAAWSWVQNRYPNDAASDLAFDANEMVDAYMAGFGSKAPQPLQQGGEVTRAMIVREKVFDHLDRAWLSGREGVPWERSKAADAILALFASLAADRDKAVGLLRRWLDADFPIRATQAFLSSQTEES